MIKILKQGNIGQVECNNCKALLQYGSNDIRHLESLDKDKNILEIDHLIFCPQCGRGINVRAKEYIKRRAKDDANTR